MLWAWGMAALGGLVVGAWAWPRGAARPGASWPAWLALAFGLALALVLQGQALGLGERWAPWASGVLLGGALGAWGALGRGGEAEGRPLGGAAHLGALGLVALALLNGAFGTDPIWAANASIALVGAWGLAELVGWGSRPVGPSGSSLALAWVASVAASVVWAPSAGPTAAAASACLPAAAWVVPALWAGAAKGEGRALPVAAGLAAALAGLSAAWCGGTTGPAAWTVALVAVVAGLAAAFTPTGPLKGPAAWVGVVLAGLGLLLLGRVGGFAAMASGGVLLLAAAAGGRGGVKLWAVLGTVFAGRLWLQLYLDRVNLTGYGMDLTHPYAHAGLWVGALMVGLAAALRAGLSVGQGACLGLGLGAAPLLLGYAWHPEALGAMAVGLGLGSAWAAGQGETKAEPGQPDALDLAPGLALGGVAFALMGAPWLVSAMQASRGPRAMVLGGAMALVLAWMAWRARGASSAQA